MSKVTKINITKNTEDYLPGSASLLSKKINKSPKKSTSPNVKTYDTYDSETKENVLLHMQNQMFPSFENSFELNKSQLQDRIDGLSVKEFNNVMKAALDGNSIVVSDDIETLRAWRRKIKNWINSLEKEDTRGGLVVSKTVEKKFFAFVNLTISQMEFRQFDVLRSKIVPYILNLKNLERSENNNNICSKHWWHDYMIRNPDIKAKWRSLPKVRKCGCNCSTDECEESPKSVNFDKESSHGYNERTILSGKPQEIRDVLDSGERTTADEESGCLEFELDLNQENPHQDQYNTTANVAGYSLADQWNPEEIFNDEAQLHYPNTQVDLGYANQNHCYQAQEQPVAYQPVNVVGNHHQNYSSVENYAGLNQFPQVQVQPVYNYEYPADFNNYPHNYPYPDNYGVQNQVRQVQEHPNNYYQACNVAQTYAQNVTSNTEENVFKETNDWNVEMGNLSPILTRDDGYSYRGSDVLDATRTFSNMKRVDGMCFDTYGEPYDNRFNFKNYGMANVIANFSV